MNHLSGAGVPANGPGIMVGVIFRTARARCMIVALGGVVMAACAAPALESGSGTLPAADGTADATVSTTLLAPEETGSTTASTEPDGSPVVDTAVPSEPSPSTTAPAPPPTVIALSGWDAVDRYLRTIVIGGGSPAASVAVMRDGELVHQAGFGRKSASAGGAVEVFDRFRVASISKTITAITMLRLVEDGVVGLDDPIGAAVAARLGVGQPVDGITDITIRQLLTHRSGFGQYEDLFFRHQVESCPEAAVAGLTRAMRDVPGASFQYSNLNFCMLGIVIEEVTGNSYSDVVNEQLLAPLGIQGMRLAATFDGGADSVEHESEDGRNYMEVLAAAGAWIATPTELVTILNSLDPATPGWKPLDAAMLEVMKTVTTDPLIVDPDAAEAPTSDPIIEPVIPESGYGMGLMIFEPGTYGHTGTVESTHAMIVHRPDGYTWALTVSGDYPGSTRQLARIMGNALLLGGFADGPYVAVPPPLGVE